MKILFFIIACICVFFSIKADDEIVKKTTYVDVLRIRNKPSIEGEIVGSIKRGEIVKVISIVTNSPSIKIIINGNELCGYWAYIEKNDKSTGYVFEPLLTDFIQYENILIIHDYDSVIVYKDLNEITRCRKDTEFEGKKYSEIKSILFESNKSPFYIIQKRYIMLLPATNNYPLIHGIFIYDINDNKFHTIDCRIEGAFHGLSKSENFMIFNFGYIPAPRGTILYSFKTNEVLYRGSVYEMSNWQEDTFEFYEKANEVKVLKRPKQNEGIYIDKYIFDNGIIKATDEYKIWKSDL